MSKNPKEGLWLVILGHMPSSVTNMAVTGCPNRVMWLVRRRSSNTGGSNLQKNKGPLRRRSSGVWANRHAPKLIRGELQPDWTFLWEACLLPTQSHSKWVLIVILLYSSFVGRACFPNLPIKASCSLAIGSSSELSQWELYPGILLELPGGIVSSAIDARLLECFYRLSSDHLAPPREGFFYEWNLPRAKLSLVIEGGS